MGPNSATSSLLPRRPTGRDSGSERSTLRALGVILVTFLVASGCGDSGTEPPASPVAELRFASPIPERVLAGTEADEPIQLRVLRANGEPAAGVEVRWVPTPGAGSFPQGDRTTTDAEGRTENRWEAGPAPGIQRLRMEAGDAALHTHVQVIEDRPASLDLVPPADGVVGNAGVLSFHLDNELGRRTATSGTALVRVLDRSGSSGIGGPSHVVWSDTVAWTEGQGEVDLSPHLTLAGPRRVRVDIVDQPLTAQADFDLVPGPPVDLIPLRPWVGIQFEAGRTLPTPPVVVVRDAFENPVGGQAVTVEVVAGSGGVQDPAPVTDAMGRADPGRWTLGPNPGLQVLRFTAGDASLDIEVEALEPRVPAELLAESAVSLSGAPGQALSSTRVRVLDQNGEALQWVRVIWTVEAGDGQLRATVGGEGASEVETLTDASGRSVLGSWTLGPDEGIQRIRAQVPGTDLELDFEATVSEAPTAGSFTLLGAYAVQTVQTPGQEVTLVGDRPAWIRVFVGSEAGEADEPAAQTLPAVDVELLHDGEVYRSWVVDPPPGGVPTGSDLAEGDWSRSYNRLVSASDVRPGMRLRVRFSEMQGTSWWPSVDGLLVEARDLEPMELRLIPIEVDSTGLEADLHPGNAETYLETARTLLPHPDIQPFVSSPYRWTGPAPASGGDHWTDLLSELRELRTESGGAGIWYGAVPLDYEQGVVGVGYIGLPVSVGWDHPGFRAWILAHELGHNLGRRHAPCFVVPFDPGFPHPEGHIDAWGLDPASGALVPPNRCDIMGYGGPNNSWISPYTFNGMLSFAVASAGHILFDAPHMGPVLRVWGTLAPDEIRLRPAYVGSRVEPAPTPGSPGVGEPVLVELLDGEDRVLWAREEPTLEISHSRDRGIGAGIPLSAFDLQDLASIRVTAGDGRQALLTAVPEAEAARVSFELEEEPGGGHTLLWDPALAPLVLLRNRETGTLLGFGEGGRATVGEGVTDLQVEVSDGVRTRNTKRVRLDPR